MDLDLTNVPQNTLLKLKEIFYLRKIGDSKEGKIKKTIPEIRRMNLM